MGYRSIQISDETFDLLQKFAIPLEDTPDTVILKLARQAQNAAAGRALMPENSKKHGQTAKTHSGTPATTKRPWSTAPLIPWQFVNWDLPNSAIAEIWAVSLQNVANRRSQGKHASARWAHDAKVEGDYMKAREREVEKVRLHKTDRLPQVMARNTPLAEGSLESPTEDEKQSDGPQGLPLEHGPRMPYDQ